MHPNPPIAIVLAWQTAANEQDIAHLLALSDPDIEIVGPRGSGYGHQLLRDWLARAGLHLTTRRVFARGEVVVVAQHGVWRSAETGAVQGEREVASRFRVVDGRVTQFARYDTLDVALEHAGLTVADEIEAAEAPAMSAYDPFVRGRFAVGVRTIEAVDSTRDRRFPCEIWYPAAAHYTGQDLDPATQDRFLRPGHDTPQRQAAVRAAAARSGPHPLILFSHSSGTSRRGATFLCTHLSSHGYVVAALDHSERVAPELGPQEGETATQRAARGQAWIANRVPDIRFLLDQLLNGATEDAALHLDPARIGIVGHSFGGWTALAATATDRRIRAVVALAPAGSSNPRPGVIPATLTFDWGRDVPTLYLVAEYDAPTPLDGMVELFARTPATKQMIILRNADHGHFADNVEEEHEQIRAIPAVGDLAWIQDMRPYAELCSEDQAHLCVRGLTLSHMDAVLQALEEAKQFLAGDLEAELARRGVAVRAHQPD